MANRWLKRASAAAAAVGLALVFGGGTAWANGGIPVSWTGNGTTVDPTTHEGTCDHVGTSDDLTPGPNQQGWLFILTSPFDSSGSSLSFTFDPANVPPDSVSPVTGVQMGGGSYHFAVYATLGAKLVSATATNGTANSKLVVSHCTDGSNSEVPPPPPTPHYTVTSEVQLANNTVIDDGSHPGTAPADVHDSVTVTQTGADVWSGTITETFYDSNNCDTKIIDSATVDIDQTTTMPVNILPETGLAAGEYSYQASFTDNGGVNVIGACEPFKIVAPPTTTPPATTPPATTPPTTTTTPGLPVTGSSLTGILVAGVALIAAGGATLFFMRRRRTTAGE
jgi:LPXTG-motif cell wall-anchored protein